MTTTTFTWDINAGIPVVLDDGMARYVYGPSGLISQKTATDDFYYLADGLGSTMAITDDVGAVVRDYRYDVYGEVTGGTGSTPNEFDFAGQQSDASTGLHYLRARYYDPATGIFLSRDPLLSHSLRDTNNPYAYAAARVVNLVDPLGDSEVPPAKGFCQLDADSVACLLTSAATPIAPGQAPSPGHVMAGVMALVGEYLRFRGEEELGQVYKGAALNESLRQFFVQANACAGDFVCSSEVSLMLTVTSWLTRGYPPLSIALAGAAGLWDTHAALEQTARQEKEDRSGRADPDAWEWEVPR